MNILFLPGFILAHSVGYVPFFLFKEVLIPGWQDAFWGASYWLLATGCVFDELTYSVTIPSLPVARS